MWRKLSRREKPPPAYEQGQQSQGTVGGDPNVTYGNGPYPQGPDYYQTGPGPWQQGGYYQDGPQRGYHGQPMYGPGPFPAGQGPYAAQGPYGPYGPGAYPRGGYYPQQRGAQTGFFGACLAALACCCCLDLLL